MQSAAHAIPNYLLYGEPAAEPDLDFVHVETVPARASLHNWEIEAHRHDGLNHVLLIMDGGGVLSVDGARLPFSAPAVLAVPPRLVHSFLFDPLTEGHILTMSEGFLTATLAALRDPALRRVPEVPLARDLSNEPDAAAGLTDAFAAVVREFHQPAAGRASAITAQVILILVALARLTLAEEPAARPPSSDLLLLARLRTLIEEHLRDHWPVERYAEALGVTASRLNAVCRRSAGASILQMVHARLLLEAKRRLIYTGMSMSEIAYALGFEDPAYFSRFFTKREGVSPLAFRQRHAPVGAA